jgi:hypothetical protein
MALVLQEWGVDLSKQTQPNAATQAYVDCLHGVAADPQQASRLIPLAFHAPRFVFAGSLRGAQ